MHVNVVKILLSGGFVGFCAEPGKGHLMQVDPERGNAVKKHIESQVVLEIIDEMGFINVLLDDVPYFGWFV